MQPWSSWLHLPTMIRTHITLSRSAFNTNITRVNSFTGYSSLALVVKANSYGLGMIPLSLLADKHPGVSWLCTVGISEALTLRAAGITKSIVVLSYHDGSLEEAIKQDIHLAATSLQEAEAISVAAQKAGKAASIHIKIDSGMGRNGLLAHEALDIIHRMRHLPSLELYGIFTHLSDTGHADLSYSYLQLERFDRLLDDLEAAQIIIPCTHALSSSSLNLKPRRRYSFMRVGAAAYGLWKNPTQIELVNAIAPLELIPVVEWKASITALKTIPAGEYVGYKRTFFTKEPTKLAMVPIGYSDGYPYALANKGKAYIRGHIIPVVGIVSMNIVAFDVSKVPDAQVGDEIILLGHSSPILPYEMAHDAGYITNLLMTGLHPAIERDVVEEHLPYQLPHSLSRSIFTHIS